MPVWAPVAGQVLGFRPCIPSPAVMGNLPRVALRFRPGCLRPCSDSWDLPIAGRAADFPRGRVEGESPHFGAVLHGTALLESWQGHAAGTRVPGCSIAPAHPCSQHPLYWDLLASLGAGAGENAPQPAAPRDGGQSSAAVVGLGPCGTWRLHHGSAGGGLGAALRGPSPPCWT